MEAGWRAAAERRLRALGLQLHRPRQAPAPRPRPPSIGNIFGVSPNLVPHKTVCCCGNRLQIPAVIYDACDMLKSHMTTEGLFRKAGSQNRQKDIKKILDAGGTIDKLYHAIDVAAILKLYLRMLPEPIVDYDIQDVLLRCLLLPETDHLSAIQLVLLFMPLLHLHILHYVMEFLKYVSLKSDLNKMDSNNLAIVIAPTIMPPPPTSLPNRVEHHVRLVKIFIENANLIGAIPTAVSLDVEEDIEQQISQKKKKRRSGSLTRMFTGLRKMVSSTNTNKPSNPDVVTTPVLDKGLNKRKMVNAQGFSAKKRKEILENVPNNVTSLTPLLPVAKKEHKKLRLSIGRKSKDKLLSNGKDKVCKKSLDSLNDKRNFDSKSNNSFDLKNDLCNNKDSEYVRIPKSEYEAIKNRVSAIENRISQEFNVITAIEHQSIEPVQQVQTVYEKTLEEAAILSSPTTDHLARRLSKELKIRQSEEHKIIRSPSARKIGVIRRRSRENGTKLIRTQTWTVSSQTGLLPNCVNKNNQFYNSINLKRGRPNTIRAGLLHPSTEVLNNRIDDPPIMKRVSLHEIPSPIPNKHLDMAYSTRSHSKRPSSFHGHSDVETPMKNFNNRNAESLKWKDGEIFMSSMENMDNSLTGRASVAQLRSRMAGMVMAKARLFDGMTDSDTSLEKKISDKPVKQSSGFARKSRRGEMQSINSSNESNDLNSLEKKIKINHYKSPGYVSKRHKSKLVKSPTATAKFKDHLNLSSNLKDVIYDVCTPLSEKNVYNDKTPLSKIKDATKSTNSFKSPRNTPHLKKSLNVKSVNSAKPTNGINIEGRKVNTPMRANHSTPRRQSPRLVSMKSRQIV